MTSFVTAPAIIGNEHWVSRDGHRLHVWEKCLANLNLKPSSAEKVTLLVHGGTYSGQTDYDLQVPGKDYSLMDHLAGLGHDVFTFAVWGYGKSDRPRDGFRVTTESALQDAAAVIEAICQMRGIDSVNILGWSWGGRISSIYAGRNRNRARRLVLYAGGAGYPSSDDEPPPTDSWRTITRENIVARIEQDLVIPDAQDAFIEAALAWDVKAPNGARLESVEKGTAVLAVPEEISTPTLIIYGARDGAYDAHQVADFFARLNTGDKELMLLPDSGHFLFIQKRRMRFFKAVAEFFNQS